MNIASAVKYSIYLTIRYLSDMYFCFSYYDLVPKMQWFEMPCLILWLSKDSQRAVCPLAS